MNTLAIVVTSINEPTASMKAWSKIARESSGISLVVVGDAKSPSTYELPMARFISIDEQRILPYRLADALPENLYQRKMLGYLEAINEGADFVYETDDDNSPLPTWRPRDPFLVSYSKLRSGSDWTNVYAEFSDDYIWPRGFPVRRLNDFKAMSPAFTEPVGSGYAPIQQGLANGSPDVDAIWRIAVGNPDPFTFKYSGSIEVAPGDWCPFNSQSTWWWPEMFPLMYLPVTVSWRVSDIWRSLVAQRCLWEQKRGIVFHEPEVYQDRNEHDLVQDLKDEMEVYEHAEAVAEALNKVYLPTFVSHRSNVVDCYLALVQAGLISEDELRYLHKWLQDVKGAMERREISEELA